MSINSQEAFTVEQFGIAFSDEDGQTVLYITGGTGSPLGIAAPVPTLYLDDNGEIWRKTGAGDSDWSQLIAGTQNFSIKRTEGLVIIPNDQQMIVKRGFTVSGSGQYKLIGNAEIIVEG